MNALLRKLKGLHKKRSPLARTVVISHLHRVSHGLKKVTEKFGVHVIFSAPGFLQRMCKRVNRSLVAHHVKRVIRSNLWRACGCCVLHPLHVRYCGCEPYFSLTSLVFCSWYQKARELKEAYPIRRMGRPRASVILHSLRANLDFYPPMKTVWIVNTSCFFLDSWLVSPPLFFSSLFLLFPVGSKECQL